MCHTVKTATHKTSSYRYFKSLMGVFLLNFLFLFFFKYLYGTVELWIFIFFFQVRKVRNN